MSTPVDKRIIQGMDAAMFRMNADEPTAEPVGQRLARIAMRATPR
ncbi:hypothetical protein ACU686_11610 [Yinghuangia aomiensis]